MNAKLLFNTIGKETLVALAKNATRKMFKTNETLLLKPTEKASQILKIIEECSFYGKAKRDFVKFAQAISEEELLSFYDQNNENLEYVPFAMIKTIEDDNMFTKNEILMIINDEYNLVLDYDDFDNELNPPDRKYFKMPTDEEIEKTVNKIIHLAKI